MGNDDDISIFIVIKKDRKYIFSLPHRANMCIPQEKDNNIQAREKGLIVQDRMLLIDLTMNAILNGSFFPFNRCLIFQNRMCSTCKQLIMGDNVNGFFNPSTQIYVNNHTIHSFALIFHRTKKCITLTIYTYYLHKNTFFITLR